MKKLTFHEEADEEVIEAARYYEERAFGLGVSFLDEIENTIEKISANPEAYQLVSDEVRHKPLRRFPYSLLYVIEATIIRVVAVAHQKQRPGYWQYRL